MAVAEGESDMIVADAPSGESGGAAPSVDTPRGEGGALDVKVADADQSLPAMMQKVAARFGKPAHHVVADIARLSFGAGRLTPGEYFSLGLYDDKGLEGADKGAFAGLKASRRIWRQTNFIEEWFGVIDDKLAFNSLMAAYGFPVIETTAYYSETLRLPGLPMLASQDELADFLATTTDYPLFGKPTNALQSLGIVSIESYDPAAGELCLSNGNRFKLADFAANVSAHYADGYMFQPRIKPSDEVAAICGDRLATVRLYTIDDGSGPSALRAAWKIPAGKNIADNFWRGNVLASIDVETGTVSRAQTGSGLDACDLTAHPDTGAALVGIRVPGWDEMVEVALASAKVLKGIGLLGWDLAATRHGCAIVETNHNPDFMLTQIADRKGIWCDRFKAFHARRREMAKQRQKGFKATMRREHMARVAKVVK